MIHHVSLGTNDLKRSRAFYDPVMAHLGLRFIKETDRMVAYGLTDVLFSLERPADGQPATAGNGAHVAFHAGHRNTVHACYEGRSMPAAKEKKRPAYAPSTIRTTMPLSYATLTAIR